MKAITNLFLGIAGLIAVLFYKFLKIVCVITDSDSPYLVAVDGVLIAVLFFAVMQILKWAVWVL